MRIRLAITTTLMIAIAVAWLAPFIQEPSRVILGLEIFFFLIVAYGIHCIRYLVRSGRKGLGG